MSGLVVQKAESQCISVTISSGQSLSAAVDLGNYRAFALVTPSTFEPTSLTFQVSPNGADWYNLYDSTGTEKSVTCSTSRAVILTPADFYGFQYLKIRGGTSGSPTSVAADRVVKLLAEA